MVEVWEMEMNQTSIVDALRRRVIAQMDDAWSR
jgi:hypothetical protein